jgi:hypothetical protein
MKKTTAALMIALLLNLTVGAQIVSAKTDSEKEAQKAEKIKAGINRLGLGRDALAEVRRRDGMTLRGYISKADSNSFVVTDVRTGASTVVPYSSVTQIRGNNLSTGAKIAIGAGIAATAIILFLKWVSQFK